MTQSRKITYSIGDTANMTGVSCKQIRHWESCGYIPKAERVVCGDRAYRRFSPDQVNLIREIREYLDKGYTLAYASKMVMAKK